MFAKRCFSGQQFMAKCAFSPEENVDSRRRVLTNPLGKIDVDKREVKLDRRRVTNRNFKGELDLGWLTGV